MLTLLRYQSSPLGTFGVLLDGAHWICHTLEPADRSGRKDCAVKAGVYQLRMEYSAKFGKLLPTIVAKGREGLRFHAGNSVSETRGCVLPGMTRVYSQLLSSRLALQDVIAWVTKHKVSQIKVIDYEELSI